MGRAIILVADGFGIGSAPDAEAFGDTGANTFAHVAQYFEQRTGKPLALPNLAGLGLVAATKAVSSDVFSLQDETPFQAHMVRPLRSARQRIHLVVTGK